LALRLYQLGVDSYWIDEFGTANALINPDPRVVIDTVRHHVMAMPLDYLFGWVVARLDTSEGTLRLTSVMWGTLTILSGYALFSRLASRRVAMWAALLLALSPIQVQYSQELRFYASLGFFYLLSSALLLRAIEEPTPRRWVLYTLINAIGIFFHVYAVLVAINGAVWLWLARAEPFVPLSRKYWIRATCVLLLVFLSGLLSFAGVYPYHIPLLLGESSFLAMLGTAFGWVPFYTSLPLLPWIWGALCLVFAAAGILSSIFTRPRSRLAVLFYAVIAQVALITGMNVLKYYFLAPRQLIFLMPLLLLFTAYAIEQLIVKAENWKPFRISANLSQTALVTIFCLASIPALLNYYQGDKGKTLEISRILTTAWRPGATILVLPDFDQPVYLYYTKSLGGGQALLDSFYGADWSDLNQGIHPDEDLYLVAPYPIQQDHADLLDHLGFQVVYTPDNPSRYSRGVWLRAK